MLHFFIQSLARFFKTRRPPSPTKDPTVYRVFIQETSKVTYETLPSDVSLSVSQPSSQWTKKTEEATPKKPEHNYTLIRAVSITLIVLLVGALIWGGIIIFQWLHIVASATDSIREYMQSGTSDLNNILDILDDIRQQTEIQFGIIAAAMLALIGVLVRTWLNKE